MFSDVLKKARKNKGLTQEQLARLISVERSSVGKYESANVIPSPEVLKRIAEYLGVSEAWLMGYDVPMDPESKADPLTEQALQVALFGGEEEVTPEMWDEVKRFAEFVKTKHKDKN